MPNRILKDSICTSPNIDTLSREGRGMGLQMLAKCGMMILTKTPTKQRQSAVFVCRKTTAYIFVPAQSPMRLRLVISGASRA